MSPCTRNTLAALLVLVAAACQPEDVAEEVAATVADEPSPLKASVTLHASFDHGADADFASGDALLYTAPSYDAQDEAEPASAIPMSLSPLVRGALATRSSSRPRTRTRFSTRRIRTSPTPRRTGPGPCPSG